MGSLFSNLVYTANEAVQDLAYDSLRNLRRDGNGRLVYRCNGDSIFVRALKQSTFQFAYASLRNLYPTIVRDIENKAYRKRVDGKTERYRQLIKDNVVVEEKEKFYDALGREVKDFLVMRIEGNRLLKSRDVEYLDANGDSFKADGYQVVSELRFVDIHAIVSVNSNHNVVLTKVQGRDFSRKEFVSGGDLNITVNGKIVADFPDIYPKEEVEKFVEFMQHKGIIQVSNTLLARHGVKEILVLSYSMNQVEGCRNVQPYSFTCVGIEPDERVVADSEVIRRANEQIGVNKKDKWVDMMLKEAKERLKANAGSMIEKAGSGLTNLITGI